MKKTNGAAFLPIGIGAGLSIGVALGVALDNLALGISLGVAIGSGLGVAMMGAASAANAKKKDSADGSDGGAQVDISDGDERTLPQVLQEARRLLLAYGEDRWAANFERAASLLAEDERRGVEAVLGFFGGMGSLTDWLPIDTGSDAVAFKALVDQAHDLAYRRSRELRS